MKELKVYILESIKKLSSNTTGIIVFDIDDTLLRVDKTAMSVYKKEPGKPEIKLSTDDFAKDPDACDPSKASWFNYRDFRDPLKVYNSIISGTPLIKNLRIMDAYIEAGYDFCFLTARGCEDTIKQAIDDWLKIKDNTTGALRKLDTSFKKTLSAAVNDDIKKYPGSTDAEKKGNVLTELCNKYDKVIFVDDDHKNVRAAKNLKLKNLTVIKAWEE